MNDPYEPPRRAHTERNTPEAHDYPPHLGMRLIDALTIVAGLLIFLALITWSQQRDEADAIEYQKAVAERFAARLATCMNGGAIYDQTTRIAHFCGKTIEVQL